MVRQDGFYVESDCCLACGVPHSAAPDLFGWSDDVCFVARQPESEAETAQMIEALASSEADCIRYAGRDEGILRRIAELDMAHVCDEAAAQQLPRVDRNYAEFYFAEAQSPEQLAAVFANFTGKRGHYRARRSFFNDKTVKVSWWGLPWHKVTFGRGGNADWSVRLAPKGGALIGLRRTVQTWAESVPLVDFVWYGRDRKTGADVPPRTGIF